MYYISSYLSVAITQTWPFVPEGSTTAELRHFVPISGVFLGLNFLTHSVLHVNSVDSTSHAICVCAITNKKVGQLIFEALHMKYMNSRFKNNWNLHVFTEVDINNSLK